MIFSNAKRIIVSSKSAMQLLKYSQQFTNKQNLPLQPVPALEDTLKLFLVSCKPFLSAQEFQETEKMAEDFRKGDGAKLQQYLLDRSKKTENWLADWWLNTAYLEFRQPVTVYSSPGQMYPLEKFSNADDQLAYAAKVILAALEYKGLIDAGKIPVDKSGKDPLDMNQYYKIFGTNRIPAPKRDLLEYNGTSKHIVVCKNNNFFKVDVLDDSNKAPSFANLMECLKKINAEASNVATPIGIMSAQNRDDWAQSYALLTANKSNEKSVQDIQKSLFLVCLDKALPKDEKRFGSDERTRASHQLITGGGSKSNSGNRWFDKTVQFVISDDGITGLTYEHSPAEGVPVAIMTDGIIDYIKEKRDNKNPSSTLKCEMKKLSFAEDGDLKKAVEKACAYVDKELVDNLDMSAFKFTEYGKDLIKTQKLSPDSFLQMAFQLTYYRMYKEPAAQYESAATRRYIHGRTETIRSCSLESVAFAKDMLDSKVASAQKMASLRKAVDAHKKYTMTAVNGFGVDRHILGLKLAAKEMNVSVPVFLTSAAITRSSHWRVTSSQVATRNDGFMAYGAAVPDGYGCCYNPRDKDILFAISAFRSHPDTCTKRFKNELVNSLMDMQKAMAGTVKAKL